MKTKLYFLLVFMLLMNCCKTRNVHNDKKKPEKPKIQEKKEKFTRSEERVNLYYSGLVNKNYKLSESIKGGEKVPRLDTLGYDIDSIKITNTNYARSLIIPSIPGDIEVFVKVYLNNKTHYKMVHFVRPIKGKRYILYSQCESGVSFPKIPEFEDRHFFLAALDSSHEHFSTPLNTLNIHFSSCENNNFNLFLKSFGNEIMTTKYIRDCHSFMPDDYHIISREKRDGYENSNRLPNDSIYTLINIHGADSSTHYYIFRNVGIYWFIVSVYGDLSTKGDALGT